MKIVADPYKSEKKNVRGGRSWVIPTDQGDLPAKTVASKLGLTTTAVNARIWKYLNGLTCLQTITGAPGQWTAIDREIKRRKRIAAGEIDPESVCEVPEELWGSLEYLNNKRSSRRYRLRAIRVGSWERGMGCRV